MKKTKIAKPIPADELPGFLACVRYGRRIPGPEIFGLVVDVWEDLLKNGHTMLTHRQGTLPAFTLLEASTLPPVIAPMTGALMRRAKITMLVRRGLPPYQSRQTYVIGYTITAVNAPIPKIIKESTARARKQAPIAVGRKLLTE